MIFGHGRRHANVAWASASGRAEGRSHAGRASRSGTLEPRASHQDATTSGARCGRSTLIAIGIGAVLFFYGIAADRITPYTAQALVFLTREDRPRGRRPRDRDRCRHGSAWSSPAPSFFRLDPDQYLLAVRRAEAQLEAAGQSTGASTAAVATAQGKRVESDRRPRERYRDQSPSRSPHGAGQGGRCIPESRRTQAQATLDSAEAIVVQAEAELESWSSL